MPYSIESTVRELMGNDAARAVLKQHLPGVASHPQLSLAIVLANALPLATAARYSGGLVTDEALRKIDKALKALG
ncbi:MAG: hypothetical protein QM740_14725 [Acidovorax sp.]